jgi:hypothetical protein
MILAQRKDLAAEAQRLRLAHRTAATAADREPAAFLALVQSITEVESLTIEGRR